jgi:hypothetical protein
MAPKGSNADISAVADFLLVVSVTRWRFPKMPGYEAIVWGVALSAGVVTIIVASTALIAG